MFKMIKQLEDGFKIIDYFGITVRVPHDASYLAIDEDGNLYSYTGKPYTSDDHWREALAATHLGIFEYKGNWKESLMKIN